jgi:hypothetical protein
MAMELFDGSHPNASPVERSPCLRANPACEPRAHDRDRDRFLNARGGAGEGVQVQPGATDSSDDVRSLTIHRDNEFDWIVGVHTERDDCATGLQVTPLRRDRAQHGFFDLGC